jgi:hypothetical protein
VNFASRDGQVAPPQRFEVEDVTAEVMLAELNAIHDKPKQLR